MHRAVNEIELAVLKFERNLSICVPYCCFGNNNKKKIVVMIDVIKSNRSKMWINSTFLSPSELLHEQPDNALWQSAMDARDWLDGDFAIEELLFKELELDKDILLQGNLFGS